MPLPKRLYLASGLFSPNERRFNQELCDILETCFQVFLPQRDGALVASLRDETSMSTKEICRIIFDLDIAAIKDADLFFAVLDGRAYDEGVCVELGYAKALGKEIVGFKSDIRSPLPWGENPMVSGCIDVWLSSTEEMKTWLPSHVR
ncbi:nucleoside 2-deoxyribosyltransferase [Massilia sp. P8910]|uniref:nucleoside 2-deoxyribosyltransferase n=1 Tax=Massilia antarctica TaxID=2765360 RepID=UPI001E5F82FB|nr:nucleoside 2-deoxyribosyltransferase [Massilia antarctica]MCE3606446.1 nucleoside 2-deoxyribosyltransferase [Massilia antarctica]